MPLHLFRDLENLKKEILALGAMVESATHKAILAVRDSRRELAEEVLNSDAVIDDREVAIEEECLKILALHQPVAQDLRFVIAVLKVNNDLERVGDLAGNIAKRALSFQTAGDVEVPTELIEMADEVRGMLRETLNALVDVDVDLATNVMVTDESVDQRHKDFFELIQQRISDSPREMTHHIELLSISRYLERIADLATNIAEDIIFLVEGEVVRHKTWT